MRHLRLLVFRELIPPLLVGVLVFTFIVFAREFGRISELFIAGNIGFSASAKLILALVARSLVLTLPVSMLVAIIIAFSRLSSDNEITALRAAGVSIYRLLRPALLIGAAVWLISSLFSVYLGPRANGLIRSMRNDLGINSLVAEFRPGVFNEELPQFVVYVEDLSVDRSEWRNIFLSDSSRQQEHRIILARRGRVLVDSEKRRLQLHLDQGLIYELDLKDVERDNLSRFVSTEFPIATLGDRWPYYLERSWNEYRTAELLSAAAQSDGRRRARLLSEFHLRFALPFSALVFCIIGLPLGLAARKGGRPVGFVIAILIFIVYYNLLFGGRRLALSGKLAPAVGAWGADVLLLLVGVALLWYSERFAARGFFASLVWRLSRAISLPLRWLPAARQAGQKAARRRPKFLPIASGYIGRSFLGFFLLTLCGSIVLFLIITIFELVDDIFRNNISASVVIDYIVYLLPQALVLFTPLAVLLGVLICFSLLEKTSQTMAFKAAGVNIWSLATPVLLIGAVLSACLYLAQEMVLPHANQRQDALLHIIKGKPPRTAYRPERKWVLGTAGHLYNYSYLDEKKNLFVGLNVYDLSIDSQLLNRRIYASRATWLGDSTWRLEDGWTRDFQNPEMPFRRFEVEDFHFPEQASYFKEERLDPEETSKLSFAELREYIDLLGESGIDVSGLLIALYRKLSFPMAALVMALIGLPFSFSFGKRGAFHGIAIGIAIGIIYWGALNFFEVLGSYGLLPPFLSAWAPNLIFSAAGLYLFLNVRT